MSVVDLRLFGESGDTDERPDGAEVDEECGSDGAASDDSDQQQQQQQDDSGTVGPPLASNLERFAESDNIFNRQMVARTLLDTLRSVAQTEEDVTTVLSVLLRLSEDPESSVRAELVEQVPHLAAFCQCHVANNSVTATTTNTTTGSSGHTEEDRRCRVTTADDDDEGDGGQSRVAGGGGTASVLGEVLPRYLLPLVVRYLADPNNQVRKTAQVALLSLVEQRMLKPEELEEQVCPVILHLTDIDSMDNFRPEAVALMCRMASMLGKELTQSLFLDRFVALCADALFQVRKVCAIHFGELCSVMGAEVTEAVLLPRFVSLCNDDMWGVRKACADVFVAVACVCSLNTRRQHLAQLFVALLADQSRWVRLAVFQALGPFISTFADPMAQQLYYDQDGNVHVAHRQEEEVDVTDPSLTNASGGSSLIDEHNLLGAGGQADLLDDGGCGGDSGFGSREASTVGSPGKDDDELEAAAEALEDQEFMEELGSILALRHGIKEKDSAVITPTSTSPTQPTCSASLPPAYDSFQFWRQPIAELDDLDLDADCPPTPLIRHRPHPPPPPTTPTPSPSSTGADTVLLHISAGQCERSRSESGVFRVLRRDAPDSDRDLFAGVRVRQREDGTNPFVETSLDSVQQQQQHHHQQVVPPPGQLHYHLGVPVYGGGSQRSRLPSALSCALQDVVPAELLNHFVHMNDPMLLEHLDNEIARFCAHSLPAVALTLGRKHWPILRALYECLASDMQWKVRRTLAFSIHELAAILGRDLAASDLVPVFNSFIRDLDEVRIGILRHLARFLSLLPGVQRVEYLPHVHKFLEPENERNWRFRLELAEQLALMAPLFAPAAVAQHLLPVAVRLLSDRVAQVRTTAAHALGQLVRHLCAAGPAPVPTPTATAHPSTASTSVNASLDSSSYSHRTSWTNSSLSKAEGTSPESDCCGLSGDVPTAATEKAERLDVGETDVDDDGPTGGCDLRALVYLSMQLVCDFAEHPKWHRRQTFVAACQQVRPHLPLRRVFAAHLLPPLLKLTADPVANVRLVVARVLADVPLDRLCPAPRPLNQQFSQDPGAAILGGEGRQSGQSMRLLVPADISNDVLDGGEYGSICRSASRADNLKLLNDSGLVSTENSERNAVIRALERLRHDLDRDVRQAALAPAYPSSTSNATDSTAATTATTTDTLSNSPTAAASSNWSSEDSASSSAVPLLLNGGASEYRHLASPHRNLSDLATPPY